MVKVGGIPTNPDDVSTSWIEGILRQAGFSGAVIAGVEAEPFGADAGILGSLARLHLTFADGRDGGAPSRLIFKFPAVGERGRQVAFALEMYTREVAFYRSIAALSPLAPPRAYFAEHDDGGEGFGIVLEDLGHLRGANNAHNLGDDDLSRCVQAIAAHHAAFWDAGAREPYAAFPRLDGPPMIDVVPPQIAMATPAALESVEDQLSPAVRRFGQALAQRLPSVMARLSEGPLTVCHGDFRPENIFFDDDAGTIRCVDYQIAGRSRGGRDLGYLFTQGIDPSRRAEREGGLLEEYRAALAAAGVAVDADRLWDDYRLGCVLSFVYAVIAVAAVDPVDAAAQRMVGTMLDRTIAAVDDLDLLAVLLD